MTLPRSLTLVGTDKGLRVASRPAASLPATCLRSRPFASRRSGYNLRTGELDGTFAGAPVRGKYELRRTRSPRRPRVGRPPCAPRRQNGHLSGPGQGGRVGPSPDRPEWPMEEGRGNLARAPQRKTGPPEAGAPAFVFRTKRWMPRARRHAPSATNRSGLRQMGRIRLRLPEIAISRREVMECEGNGVRLADHDGALPDRPVLCRTSQAPALHGLDAKDAGRDVELPLAIDRKVPNASKEWRRRRVFPQQNRWRNRTTGEQGRNHVHETALQRSVREDAVDQGVWRRRLKPRRCVTANGGPDTECTFPSHLPDSLRGTGC